MGKNQEKNALREDSALREVKKDNWQHGNCAHCATEFKKKTTWQKYCGDSCRAMAYELRTGKKLHIATKPKVNLNKAGVV